MYQPRNPYTPKQGEVFTPQQFLSRYLVFYSWDAKNKPQHLTSCHLQNHFEVLINGFCCLGYLKRYIECKILDLAGCRAGLWAEPEGYQVWLSFAWKRLEELEDSHDYFDLWTKTLKHEDQEMYAWVANSDNNPGFSANSFRAACLEYDFQPDPELLSLCFD